jgi:hypothetical protein
MMAELFQKYSGIDPFTIDEVELMEKSSSVFENPSYRYFVSKHKFKSPQILFSLNKPFCTVGNSVDVLVIFPRTIYIKGRASWLNLDGGKMFYEIWANG